MPFYAFLEGCNQVATVNRFRLWQALTGSLAMWTCLALNMGLWTTVVLAGVKVVWDILLLGVRYRVLFLNLRESPHEGEIAWRDELWPLQWRLAVQGAFAYFSSSLLVPVLWEFQGPEMAGRMGMSWNVLSAIQAGALVWVQARAPRFGNLVAHQEFESLDILFRRVVRISWLLGGTALLGYWSTVALLEFGSSNYVWMGRLAHRFVDPTTLGILSLVVFCQHVPHCVSYYIRAHKRETLMALSVTFQLANGILIFTLSHTWGARGSALALLINTLIILIPWQSKLWRDCRRERNA